MPILKDFAERKHITFTMLSDPDSKIIRAYGILNEAAPKGVFFGIPHPGTFLLDSKGVVVSKYFEDDYTQRYTASDILVKQFGASAEAARSTVAAKHLTISASSGTAVVHSGQRIALALDIDLKAGIHVYAPGVKGYIPIDLAIPESPAIITHAAVYPPSKMLHLPAIDETVPVYVGQIRVVREVTIGKAAPAGDLVIEGTLRYQACDDRQCFIPETASLRWVVKVEPHDRQRAPSGIQHK